MKKDVIEKIQEWLNNHPVDVFWDYREGFGKESVTKILAGDLDEVYDSFWEMNIDYIYDLEMQTLKEAIDLFWPGLSDVADIDEVASELRDHVDVIIDMNFKDLARYTDAYICVELPVEHDSYWREYSDVRDELEYFGINPAELREFFTDVRWYDCPTRTKPLLKTRVLVEAWVNCGYSGAWHAMLDARTTLELAVDRKLDGTLTLKAGANLIIHDYWNGASSMNEPLLVDIDVEAKEIFHDGASRYGIQSCCGFIDSAWNGELEVK